MKRSWPYFSHAAMQSGGFQEWATKSLNEAGENFVMFTQKMNCTGNSLQIRQCLQEADVAQLVTESTEYTYPHEDSWTACRWAPVIDGVELSMHPNKLLQSGDVHPTANLILGTNADEGADFIGYNKTGFLPRSLPVNLTKAGFVKWATAQFGGAATAKLLALFPVPSDAYPTYWTAAQRVVGLYMMTCPNRRFAKYHAETRQTNSTFVYYFAELPGTIPTRRGVFHGADIRFVFFNVVRLLYLIATGACLSPPRICFFFSDIGVSDRVGRKGFEFGNESVLDQPRSEWGSESTSTRATSPTGLAGGRARNTQCVCRPFGSFRYLHCL
eukprot:m.275449 g.275449  ORF g.275449 m.275449 type:complete len:328 (+) comp16137_c0_seq11:1022-2005(+)